MFLQIVRRYDIILIQELRGPDGKVTDKLKALVNQDIPINSPHHFDKISSEPQGPGGYKERYLFLYKFQKVSVTCSFQYDEGKRGVFSRPPFVVKFSSTQTAVKEFVLIPIHTKPDHAVEELNALVKVVDAAKLKWTNNNIMVLGDFNADGTYVTKKDWKNIRLFTNTYFHWLIANGVDTTVAAKSSNTYDRIVVTTEMEKGVEGSAEVFNFKTNYGLTQAQAEDVSDHFPVEVRLKLKP
ncbi:hypothetical protein OYC64_006651 [Pagothenia borchgrevinki]|uniref:Endonuclease/exonuclease/phosphatase domain-containing protein n=1 Tax=Pagothenia borchgrevinki TaxID=8213 RepID=A0ABD2GL42_PAGBO